VTRHLNGPARSKGLLFTYATNYLIDVESAIILDIEATRAVRWAEVGASRTMLIGVKEMFGLKPAWVAADSAYGSAANSAWLVKQKKVRIVHPGL
jgi:hypothetical protein